MTKLWSAVACAGLWLGCNHPAVSDAGEDDAGPVDAGQNGDSGSDAGSDGGFVPAPHLPLPALTWHHGTMLHQPHVVTVTWSGYPFESDAQALGDQMLPSSWFTAVTSEYGVTSGTHLSKKVLSTPLAANITDADLANTLISNVLGGTLPSPNATQDLMFLVYIPPNVTVDANAITMDGTLCGAYYGYHSWAADAGLKFPYAVSGDCDGMLTSITALASHELGEAVLDPYDDGWSLTPPPTDDWFAYTSFENADLCQWMPDPMVGTYSVERGWSNAAAAAGGNPCVPVPAGEIPYSDVSPPFEQAVSVDAGTSITVPIVGWAIAARTPWPVVVNDWPNEQFATSPTISASMLNNGGTATVTLSVPAGTPPGQWGAAVIYSGSAQGRFWPITIYSR